MSGKHFTGSGMLRQITELQKKKKQTNKQQQQNLQKRKKEKIK